MTAWTTVVNVDSLGVREVAQTEENQDHLEDPKPNPHMCCLSAAAASEFRSREQLHRTYFTET